MRKDRIEQAGMPSSGRPGLHSRCAAAAAEVAAAAAPAAAAADTASAPSHLPRTHLALERQRGLEGHVLCAHTRFHAQRTWPPAAAGVQLQAVNGLVAGGARGRVHAGT